MGNSAYGDSSQGKEGIPPEILQKVTEKVYALWLKDLQIERERKQAFMPKQIRSKQQ